MTSLRFGAATLGLLLAGSAAVAMPAAAQTAFTTLDRTAKAEVEFSSPERGKPVLAGSEVAVSGENFRPNQQVALLYGAAQLPGGSFTADAEGKIAGRIAVPANAVSGTHPILVVAQAPYYATVAELKVSPTIPLSGQTGYEVRQAHPVRGLYQSAYSAKTNAVFLTSAIGRPPVHQSELVKLDADSMKVLARATPGQAPERAGGAPRPAAARPANAAAAAAPQGPGVYAVYGVAVDDARGNVWVTNTRQNTVAVYRQSDLGLVKQFEPGAVGHPRDVAVDAPLGKAYVTAVGAPEVYVFDTAGLTANKAIPVKSAGRGKEFSGASLSLDQAAHKLYVVGLSTGEVAVIDTRTDAVEKVFAVPGIRSAIGVSHDPLTGRIFVVGQGSDNLVVLDGASGAVIADTPIGAGALNVVFDPVKRRAYVSNRGAGTIAVADADGKLVANLGPAPMANHVALGKGGVVYAVDKSAGALDADSDTVLRIRPR
ncbi:YncE family protein [Novosphingobium resinovorum]|uniref:YncE family protein n=1 Tax=Novosphingobium resinovorum TaxID=158500 RepID=UPI002ED5FFF2|nr:YncE family protein [Novosphingobium resinovorum]